MGEVMEGEMRPNQFGEVVAGEWSKTTLVRPQVELDAFVVMPNHFHAIINLNEDVGATRRVALPQTAGPPQNSIGAIVGQFKSLTTKQINRLRNTPGADVWQRNYYEHIIRNPKKFEKIRNYIVNNPLKWDFDQENPEVYTNKPNWQKARLAEENFLKEL